MHTFVKRALWGAAIAGGMTLLDATAAGAVETGGDDGILSGTQIQAPLSIPIEVAGNAISVLGSSSTEAPASPAPAPEPEPAPAEAVTGGSDGIGSGSQAVVEVAVPVTVSGNAVSVLGESRVSGDGGSPSPAPSGGAADPVALLTNGSSGLLGGSQVAVPISIPLTVGGNGVAILGQSAVTGTTPAPGADPGPVPGVDPGPVPGTDPGGTPGAGAALSRAAATGGGLLATTGGGGLLPAAAAALGLLGLGGALLRRRPV
ncbi:MAG: chaplin family protein [Leucobacter sp.]